MHRIALEPKYNQVGMKVIEKYSSVIGNSPTISIISIVNSNNRCCHKVAH